MLKKFFVKSLPHVEFRFFTFIGVENLNFSSCCSTIWEGVKIGCDCSQMEDTKLKFPRQLVTWTVVVETRSSWRTESGSHCGCQDSFLVKIWIWATLSVAVQMAEWNFFLNTSIRSFWFSKLFAYRLCRENDFRRSMSSSVVPRFFGLSSEWGQVLTNSMVKISKLCLEKQNKEFFVKSLFACWIPLFTLFIDGSHWSRKLELFLLLFYHLSRGQNFVVTAVKWKRQNWNFPANCLRTLWLPRLDPCEELNLGHIVAAKTRSSWRSESGPHWA